MSNGQTVVIRRFIRRGHAAGQRSPFERRDTIRNRTAARAREAGEFLLTWSIPLIATALVFAAVIIWFWWAS